MSNPATLTPVGYLQFETGTLGALDSPEFLSRVEFNEVIKLAVSRRFEFVEASEPAVHYMVNGISSNGIAEVFLGAQVVLLPGEGPKPTLAASYSRRVYDGGAPELDIGSPLNSAVFYASADMKGFHYDANAVFNEVLEGSVRRLQFAQTLSISHPLGRGFGLSGEIWRFTQPFLSANAIGNLWATSYAARKNLIFDAGFEKGLTGTSTHWEAFAGLTLLAAPPALEQIGLTVPRPGSGRVRPQWRCRSASCICIVEIFFLSLACCRYIVSTGRRAMRTTVKKWGNSAAIRIPASVMQATRLELDEAIEVREEAGRIVIEPVRQKTYDLAKLVRGTTSKNKHAAVDFGSAMGKEGW